MTIEKTDALETRRRRLRFRSWHRGMRETDLLLGGFADACLDTLTEAEIEQYEALLEIPDADLLDWITGRQALPARYHCPVAERLAAFCRTNRIS